MWKINQMFALIFVATVSFASESESEKKCLQYISEYWKINNTSKMFTKNEITEEQLFNIINEDKICSKEEYASDIANILNCKSELAKTFKYSENDLHDNMYICKDKKYRDDYQSIITCMKISPDSSCRDEKFRKNISEIIKCEALFAKEFVKDTIPFLRLECQNDKLRENAGEIIACIKKLSKASGTPAKNHLLKCSRDFAKESVDLSASCQQYLKDLAIPEINDNVIQTSCPFIKTAKDLDFLKACFAKGATSVSIYQTRSSQIDYRFLLSVCTVDEPFSVSEVVPTLSCLRSLERKCKGDLYIYSSLTTVCKDETYRAHAILGESCSWQDYTSEHNQYRRDIEWGRRDPYPKVPASDILQEISPLDYFRFSTLGM